MTDTGELLSKYQATRARTMRLAESLSAEDQQIQACPEASPTKWHLAHTTWFFEEFVLGASDAGPPPFHPRYQFLFNSYYESVGPRHARPQRGLLSRPSLHDVHAYRSFVDDHVTRLLQRQVPRSVSQRLVLGIAHEEQHQELILTDILANFAVNPLLPGWRPDDGIRSGVAATTDWVAFEGGLFPVGAEADAFHFDNEGPSHRVFLEPFSLRSTLVTNAEVAAFVEAEGYQNSSLWLSDGLEWAQSQRAEAPHYWRRGTDGWSEFTLYGERPLDPQAPATHLNGYEADAIATWLGARLPTEQEWEVAARSSLAGPDTGRWLETGPVVPLHARAGSPGLQALWGECWEWTRSAYAPYPGFRPAEGALGEYNGKFMCNQWVLRGGSCATPPGHVRVTYRNFFYPSQHWQFSGVRLAKDRS